MTGAKQRTRRLSIPNLASPPSNLETSIDLHDPDLYINRELSLLAFQQRVLQEAQDNRNPLLERVKFLAIVGSNLDEFFMVRTAGLLAQLEAGIVEVGPDRLSPQAQLVGIRREVKRLFNEAHKCLEEDLIPAMEAEEISLLEYSEINAKQCAKATAYFNSTIFPVLTPLAFDPGRPFPHISNLSLNLAVLIQDAQGSKHFARIKVPDSLPQLVHLNQIGPSRRKRRTAERNAELVWIEDVITANLGSLFPGMEVLEAHAFHVTRDADIAIRELEAEDLLESIEEGLRQRRFGSVVRLMVARSMPKHILNILMNNLEIDQTNVFRVYKPLGLSRLMSFYDLDRPDLKYAPFTQTLPKEFAAPAEGEDFLEAIRKRDILLHHPYDSFQPTIEFLRKAAQDDQVLAIKMVLYRIGKNSPIVEALLTAMENRKQVAVLVELKARFDEESNIEWARRLEEVGVHVVYGLLGLKIHCKVTMVVRREGDMIRRYVHLGTGNYNAVTSHFYTDVGIFTCDDGIADDVTHLFNFLTGYSGKSDYKKLLVAPVNLRARLTELIEREIELSASGVPGELVFKMNSLVDPSLIRQLYRASQAGVKIRLIVRGTCCLRPGLPGVSDNIDVISIVGRFLEHSRIYYFGNGNSPQMYLGSADLMPRNLDRRVEVLFPVSDEQLLIRLRDEVLAVYQTDTMKARRMQQDGSYVHINPAGKEPALNSQEQLLRRNSATASSS